MVDGLLIQDVDESSPAAKAGLEAGELDVTVEGEPWVLGGDILVSLNGQDLRTPGHYARTLQGLKAGQTVELRVFRDGDYRTVSVTLGERPIPSLPQQRPKTDVPPLIPQALPYSQF
jgi:S1-C subfamily serine protease